MIMKILSFGHIPSWAGGRQESGLANVIYQLASHMAACDDVQMSMAATDVFVPELMHDNLRILGWTKGLLVKYSLTHPLTATSWLLIVINAKLKFGPVVSIPGFFFKGLHLHRAIHLEKPQVVHLHGMSACVYGKIVPRQVKIVLTMHGIIGVDATIPNQPNLKKMEREVCYSHRYSMMVFIAKKLISDFRSIYGTVNSRCEAILNAYDAKAFHYIESVVHEGITLATVASLSENKGQERVVEAIAKSGVGCRYFCIGGDSEGYDEKISVIASKARGKWEYLGKKTPAEIRTLLAEADYMILPSSTEGFGLVYLEAIACGVPVILPKHLPIVQEKSIIQPGVNALLLEDSSVVAIAALLLKLKDCYFDHRKVAQSIVNYSWENIAKQYVESFKRM